MLERQRASPTAAKYAVVGSAGDAKYAVVGSASDAHGPATSATAATPAGMMSSPAAFAIHRELLAPLTGSRTTATLDAHASAIAGRGGGGGARGAAPVGALGVNSGSPVRLPSLESSPVPMKPDERAVGLGVGPSNGTGSSNGGSPVLIGQGGHQWRGNLAGSGGAVAARWPARHKFSLQRHRFQKLQPVGLGMGDGVALPAAGVAADGTVATHKRDVHDYADGGADGDIEQAW